MQQCVKGGTDGQKRKNYRLVFASQHELKKRIIIIIIFFIYLIDLLSNR